MIYFTSDTHYGHKNIVRGESRWPDDAGCRDFDTVKEMNDILVENINTTVGEDDVLYHLGDWSFGGLKNIFEFRQRLKVKTVHLLLGNHDENIRKNREGCQALFTSVSDYKEIKIESYTIILSHYSFRVWNRSHKGSWMLFGHSHNTLQGVNDIKSMDVGIDAHPEFRPFSYEEIKKIMNKRKIINVDKHESR